ncbi:hypothetical protein [Thalassomonas actiniarum]|uniref:Uncharacterized protein n=1 Tax=Thalassomonas actiniarum TaxID=485447 RepID=A0AAF0C3S7_9GAMM|nr:hypothetical protein [Thalassomonas actiniarum]WDD99024.1 hypothetical protein SG35_028035 [Thalassomonas actiniarum]
MSRYIVAVMLGLGYTSAIQAFDLKDELMVCAATKDSLSRLACYDKLVQERKLSTGSEDIAVKPRKKAAGDVAATTQSKNKADDFGKAHIAATAAEEDNSSMFSEIDKVKELHYGKLALTLTNGQVWHQTDSNKLLLEAGDKVELIEGMLSAIYLRKDGFNKRIRVKRIK